MVKEIKYTYPLDYEDVLQYLPFLTTDNDVVTDGKILHLEIILAVTNKPLHLFIDLKTKEYCFSSNTTTTTPDNDKDTTASDLLYEVGDMVLSKIHRFKLNRYEVDFDGLVGYIQKNVTAC